MSADNTGAVIAVSEKYIDEIQIKLEEIKLTYVFVFPTNLKKQYNIMTSYIAVGLTAIAQF